MRMGVMTTAEISHTDNTQYSCVTLHGGRLLRVTVGGVSTWHSAETFCYMGMITPFMGMIIPALGITIPDMGMIIPALGMTVSDTGMIIATLGMIIPDMGMIIPALGIIIPDAGIIIDDTAFTISRSESVTLDTGDVAALCLSK